MIAAPCGSAVCVGRCDDCVHLEQIDDAVGAGAKPKPDASADYDGLRREIRFIARLEPQTPEEEYEHQDEIARLRAVLPENRAVAS